MHLTVAWKRSSKCVADNHCVEVAAGAEVRVRDSKDPSPVIVFDREVWQAFVRWIG